MPSGSRRGGESARHAPATGRNREPIGEVLGRVLPAQGLVLEIASGTGEHAVFFASRFVDLIFQPSDPDPAARSSVGSWVDQMGVTNVRPPIALDAREHPWPVERADAILCINMIHIAPWEACLGLMRGAGSLLPVGGPLVTYGPYRLGGRHTAPSNEAFDAGLRARDPRWGVRDVDEVVAAAAAEGLAFHERVPMPANNFTLIFRKTGEAG